MLGSMTGQKSFPDTLQPMSDLLSQNYRERIVNNPFLNHNSLPRTINESVNQSSMRIDSIHMNEDPIYNELRIPKNNKRSRAFKPGKLNMISHESYNKQVNTDRTQKNGHQGDNKISDI